MSESKKTNILGALVGGACIVWVYFLVVGTSFANEVNVDSHPTLIKITDDHRASVDLSRNGINRIFVVDDKISSVHAPSHRLVARNEESGSIFATVSGEAPFVTYFSTKKGRHFSLFVNPTPSSGVTVKIISNTPPSTKNILRNNVAAKRFEHSTPYEKTLSIVLMETIKGRVPSGYTALPSSDFYETPIANISKHPLRMKHLSQKVEKVFLGGELSVRVIKITNHSKKTLSFLGGTFYLPGVRAASLDRHTLLPQQSTRLYEVVSNA